MLRQTFTLRLLRDAQGVVYGQLTDLRTGRQALFSDADGLWRALVTPAETAPAESASAPASPGASPPGGARDD
jgi:hypothetical protein